MSEFCKSGEEEEVAATEGDGRWFELLLEVADCGDGVIGMRFGEKVFVKPAAAAAPGPRLRECGGPPPPLAFMGTPRGRLPNRAARSAASASQNRCCCWALGTQEKKKP